MLRGGPASAALGLAGRCQVVSRRTCSFGILSFWPGFDHAHRKLGFFDLPSAASHALDTAAECRTLSDQHWPAARNRAVAVICHRQHPAVARERSLAEPGAV